MLDLFTHRWLFTHEHERSREYRSVARCVGDGLDVIEHPNAVYQIDTGDGFSQPRDIVGTAARLRTLLRKKKVGEVYTVIATHAQHMLVLGKVRFRVVRTLPDPAAIPGTAQTKQWAGVVQHLWPRARFAGSVVCKANSDHAFGAAVDYFDTPANMAAMHEAAISNAETLGTKYSIYEDDIWLAGPPWTDGSRGHHKFTGAYHLHHHRSSRDGRCGVFCSPGFGECG